MENNNRIVNTDNPQTPIVSNVNNPVKNNIFSILTKYSWIAFAFSCLVIGYLLIWQRGLYSDDYSLRVLVVNPVTGASIPFWQLPNDQFPMRILVWVFGPAATALIPEYEIWVRLVLIALTALNALLVGVLIQRTLKSKFAGLIAGLLFMMPIWAAETVLWLTTVTYLISTAFAIAAILFAQKASAMESNGRWKIIILGVLMIFLMMITFEGCMAAVGILTLFSLLTAYQQKQSVFDALKTTFSTTVWILLTFIIISLVFTQSPMLASRGGVSLSFPFLLKRSKDYLDNALWLTTGSDWGGAALKEAFIRGFEVLFSSSSNVLTAATAVVLLAATVFTWRNEENADYSKYSTGIFTLLIGVIWVVASILIPGIFAKGQGLEFRMLYFPTAGFCIVVGAALWIVLKLFRFDESLSKVFVGLIGVIVLLNSVIILGYNKLYAERNAIDRQEIASVVSLFPPDRGLPQNVTLVLYKFDANANFENKSNYVSNRLLTGVFETEWSSKDSLRPIYKRYDINTVVNNRFNEWRFEYDPQADVDKQLVINTRPIPINNTFFITYKDGAAVPVKTLNLKADNGTTAVITFPLAEALELKGVPTLSIDEKLPAELKPAS